MPSKIIFFIARYSISGVPLAQLRLAKAFCQRGYKVQFVIGFIPSGLTLPRDIPFPIVNLNQPRTFKLLRQIRKLIRLNQPDVIFSAEDHLNAIVTIAVILAGSDAKLSVSSRVTPYDTYSAKRSLKNWVLKIINRMLWKRADVLTCVSNDMVSQYHAIFGSTKHQAVYNVIVDSGLEQKKTESVEHPWFGEAEIPVIISAGRLAPEKGYPDLIAAIKLVNKSRTVRLLMMGEGPLRGSLQQLIDDLNLKDRVQLLGFQANPYKYYSRADVFVLSSYVEGLPNVLVEAMACGCSVVSTDCPTGPREVLLDGKYGSLVPINNPQALAKAIEKAIAEPTPKKLIKAAIAPFEENTVLQKHFESLGVCLK